MASEAFKKARKSISDGFGKKLSVYVSTIVTWFLTGLWHGAAWNFVVWGLLNAFFILLAEEFKPLSVKFREKHARLISGFGYRVFETLRTFFLMCSLRILDCYRDVAVSFKAFGSIFTTNNWGEAFSGELLKLGLTGADYLVAGVGVALMFAVSCVQEKCGCVRELMWKRPPCHMSCLRCWRFAFWCSALTAWATIQASLSIISSEVGHGKEK